jgi:hypothetical protein
LVVVMERRVTRLESVATHGGLFELAANRVAQDDNLCRQRAENCNRTD